MTPFDSLDVRFFNSASRAVEPFDIEGPVGLYVCGITPYDSAHLGHAFTYTVFDVLVRFLRFLGRQVTYVQNVTDIDDDILRRAAQTNDDWKALGTRETQKYLRAMAAINNLPPDVMPRATDHIPEMLRITEALLARGFAYEREGSVYFEVARAPSFGKLSRLDYAQSLATANERGNYPDDPLKKDPLDFVLWQAARPGEPSWPSPWGEGRPGWHIECSAMSMKYLGETFAIHGGGADLLFPHHECEAVQSESFTGRPFVRIWMHAAMVYCGTEKMSKSLGNMVFVHDLLRTCPGDAIRLYLLQHRYRHPFGFDARGLAASRRLAGDLARAVEGAEDASPADIELCGRPLLAALADDLDTPAAVDHLRTLAASPDAAARRSLRTLGATCLGLTFSPNAAAI